MNYFTAPPLTQAADPRRRPPLPHLGVGRLKAAKCYFDAIAEASGIVIPREATALHLTFDNPHQQPPVYSRHNSVRHYRALPQASGVETGGSCAFRL